MKFLGFKLEESLKKELEKNLEYDLHFSDNVPNFLEKLKGKKFDIILMEEFNLQEEALINLIKKSVEYQKKCIIIIIGERSNLNVVAGSLKAGAYDYILKPISSKDLISNIEKSVKDQSLMAERVNRNKNKGDKLIGQSREIVELYKQIGKVAKNMLPVLVVGEKGTGKTSVATAIHEFSNNNNNPFMTIDCLSLGNELIERKLFGYERGAFKGAILSQIGDLKKIDGGTLHIGSIEALSLDMQSKILYFVQTGEYFPMGSATAIKSDVRIIASTSENLDTQIIVKLFISELYSRLRVLEIIIPPLRERKNDIPLIIDHYIRQCNQDLNANVKGVSKPALKRILRYDWPGNVYELKNAVKTAVAVSRNSSILLEDLPNDVQGSGVIKTSSDSQIINLKEWIRNEMEIMKKRNNRDYYEQIIVKIEKELITQILERTNGKKSESAEILGITRNTLRTKMNNYNLK